MIQEAEEEGGMGVDGYDVTWDSPSGDSSGTMPAGNGDIGINVWVEEGGDLLIYIGKTDAWDENARLAKLGRLRVHLEPNPFRKGVPFRQTLRLRRGEIEIRAGNPWEAVTLRVWVDANHPAIRVQADGGRPFELRAALETWRGEAREMSGEEREAGSAWGLARRPIVILPDTVLPAGENRIVWYHRVSNSLWHETLVQQGMADWAEGARDPVLNLTFGGIIAGPGLVSAGGAALRSPGPRKSHLVCVDCLTAQTDTPEEWIRRIGNLAARVDETPLARAIEAHGNWWREFWDRSWIRVSPESQKNSLKDFRPVPPLVSNELPLRIGADAWGTCGFVGDIARVGIYARALEPEEIERLAGAGGGAGLLPGCIAEWSFDGERINRFPNRAGGGLEAMGMGKTAVVDAPAGKALRLGGDGWLEAADDPRFHLTDACTLEALIAPGDAVGDGGHILDKSTGGSSDGFFLETRPGASLGWHIAGSGVEQSGVFSPGRWVHVAATYDTRTAEQTLCVDGRVVARARIYPAAGPFDLSRGYALQRYVTACAGRGAFPIKFNGSLFNVDAIVKGRSLDADFRMWGGICIWQNCRLAYWPMLSSGDFEMMNGLFRFYEDMLPFLAARTKAWFGHGGAFFPETMYPWGAYLQDDYGTDRGGKPVWWVSNQSIRYHFTGNLELLAMMIDYHAHTQSGDFLENRLLPAADALLRFWEEHFPRDERGLIRMDPAQCLETYRDVANPTTDIAGLHWVLARLLELPPEVLGAERRDRWVKFLGQVPPVPVGEQNGKKRILIAGEVRGKPQNYENPEMYPVFPFRFYGVGKDGLDTARRTYEARGRKWYSGWHQDEIDAACLGLVEEVRRRVPERFARKHPGSRFPGFFGPNWDGIAEQCHASNGMTALQRMLLQADGGKILLFPAWPKEWDVEFKLHAPMNTVIECVYRKGRIRSLAVSPEARRKDVTVMPPR
jgi:hypothetical protein